MRQVAGHYAPVDGPDWRYYPRFAGPDDDGSLARQLWQSDTLKDLRYFARYPARYPTDEDCGCIWFAELLYALPEQTPPFIYGSCRDEKGNWGEVRRRD